MVGAWICGLKHRLYINYIFTHTVTYPVPVSNFCFPLLLGDMYTRLLLFGQILYTVFRLHLSGDCDELQRIPLTWSCFLGALFSPANKSYHFPRVFWWNSWNRILYRNPPNILRCTLQILQYFVFSLFRLERESTKNLQKLNRSIWFRMFCCIVERYGRTTTNHGATYLRFSWLVNLPR